MEGRRRLVAVILMILILMFALIHLGVSIGILVDIRNYGDVYRPEKGLAAFDLVISIYGLIIGGFGLFSVLTYRSILSKYQSWNRTGPDREVNLAGRDGIFVSS